MTQNSVTTLDLEDLRTVVADIVDVDVAEVTDEAGFVSDLEVDSLLALELAVQLEKRYGIKVGDDELPKFTNLRATYSLLSAKLAAA
jgi:acyl carrier protein